MVRNIYTGKVVTLNVDTVQLPNGFMVDLETIRHPGASAVVPIKDDGAVVLIRQFRHAAGGFIYEIPAGKLDRGEDPLNCAARELEEEVGYRAASFQLLSSIFTAPGFADEVIHIYKAIGLTKGQQQLDRDEVLEIVEMPLDQAIEKIQDGTIRDGKTIIGLQAVYIQNVKGRV
ncbi:MAG: Methanol dehydrogenase activator [Candidatus Nitrospira kreftii]|uniref:GDP-mannose pyrophosphatase n=1 Tax=Candidatus Nitrospira kreftii TaxID=2652173 RepID=A0A7S8FHP8_9BACT|nr:MAG: Methanol dehydrogenase activator [Candidatus Nitrospira kreftii]